MASKTPSPPGTSMTRSAAPSSAAPVAGRARESLERAVREARTRAAERKLRQLDLRDMLQSSLPTLATAPGRRAAIRPRPGASIQPTVRGAYRCLMASALDQQMGQCGLPAPEEPAMSTAPLSEGSATALPSTRDSPR